MASNQYDEFLFDGAHQALTFAFRYSGQAYSPSAMMKAMRGASAGSGKGLAGLDGAAQAGLVRGIIARKLDVYEHRMIVARFAADEREMYESRAFFVSVAIANMGTGMHSRRISDALVQRFFGKKIYLADMATKYGISQPTMTRRWQAVRGVLRSILDRAEESAHQSLREAGLIP